MSASATPRSEYVSLQDAAVIYGVSIDLQRITSGHHLDLVAPQVLGQPRALGAGAFDPDRGQLTEGVQQGQQLSVACLIRAELAGAKKSADMVHGNRIVGVAVGIDAARYKAGRCCHAHLIRPSIRLGRSPSRVRADKTVMGLGKVL